MRFRSINEQAAVEAAQKEWDDLDIQGQRPPDAVIYEVELAPDEPTTLQTQWGEINVSPGDYIFTDPEGNKFAVHPTDAENVWLQLD